LFTKSSKSNPQPAIKKRLAPTVDEWSIFNCAAIIGNTKSAYFNKEWNPATIATMKALKKAFDPGNRLNPGKIFPD
jgi:hypothetical protein